MKSRLAAGFPFLLVFATANEYLRDTPQMRKQRSPSYLKTWMINATAQEIRTLAKDSGTTVNYLHQISGGFRNPSLELSAAIVRSAARLRELRPALPELSIEYLSPPCHSCVYFKRCKGDDGRAAVFVDGE